MAIRCDPLLLDDADWSFVVLADTHYMAAPDAADPDAVGEFPSRRVQGERAAAVWETVAGLDPAFVVHLGDLVQEYPGRAGFAAAQAAALAQIEAVGLKDRVRFVAGNHDVGDKPDPTMPTHAVTGGDLTAWEQCFGPSFVSWRHGDLRFVTLNSQILNTGLPAAARQHRWLAEQLAQDEEDLILFLHLPLYLHDRDDPHLGHYDTVAEPDRTRLLRLLGKARLRHLFAAHVHFRFYDRLPLQADSRSASLPSGLPHRSGAPTAGDRTPAGTAEGEYWICASPTFTRPGFGALFAAAPAPERGRDDTPKLGFYYCRVTGDRVKVLFVPTGDGRTRRRYALTPTGGGSQARLGLTLTQPLVTTGQVPLAYPSLVRQPVRNDYPFLLVRELGAGLLRLPVADLDDPLQAQRLRWLRRGGIRLQGIALGLGAAARAGNDLRCDLDTLEVQLPGALVPTRQQRAQLAELGLPLVLCAVVPGALIPGKQHPRTRIGYRRDEVAALLPSLAGLGEVGVILHCDPSRPLTAVELQPPGDHAVRWQLLLGLEDAGQAPRSITRALLQAAAWGAPLFIEPLLDLDRTMDGAAGLLDGSCNPRPAWETARVLTALLRRVGGQRVEVAPATECVTIEGHRERLQVWPAGPPASYEAAGIWYELRSGTVAAASAVPAGWRGPVACWLR